MVEIIATSIVMNKKATQTNKLLHSQQKKIKRKMRRLENQQADIIQNVGANLEYNAAIAREEVKIAIFEALESINVCFK